MTAPLPWTVAPFSDDQWAIKDADDETVALVHGQENALLIVQRVNEGGEQ